MYVHQVSTIALAAIDGNDTSFELRPAPEPPEESLIGSIRRWGLLHPPIVVDQGNLLIVSGRKRLTALRDHLGVTRCPCIVLPAGTGTTDAIALAVTEAMTGPGLSPAQRALAVRKVTDEIGEEECAALLPPIWGEAPKVFIVNRYLRLATLEIPLLAALHQGVISDKTAAALSEFSFRDRFAFFDVITALSLSVSHQRRLLELTTSLGKRHDISAHALFSQKDLTAIINERAPVRQRAERLIAELDRRLRPRLSAATDDFAAFVKELDLPATVRLSPTSSFEDEAVHLQLTLADRWQAQQVWQEICKIID